VKKTAVEICRKLQKNGFKAFFAGGAVRDQFLGKNPSDIDIATDARPEIIENLFKKSFAIGKKFGVILVSENGHHFEIATFRSDSGNSDGRRPDAVFFTDERADARRRDFTVNAIFFDPIAEKYFDFVGGISDLKNKILRFVGDPTTRIREDFLRILRAIRFKNRLEFSFDQKTAAAIFSEHQKVAKIAPERVRDEFSKMLLDKNRAKSFRDCFDFGVLKILLPELSRLAKTPDAFGKKTVFEHTMRAISFLKNPNLETAWATLFHDLGKFETATKKADRWHFPDHENLSEMLARKICRRLRFSRFSTTKIAWLVKNHIKFYAVPKMSRAHKMHFFDHLFFEDLIALARADSLGSDGSATLVSRIEKDFHDAHEQKLLPKFHAEFLTGDEIQNLLNIPPGKKIGEIKKKLRFLQFSGEIVDKKSAKKWLFRHFKN